MRSSIFSNLKRVSVGRKRDRFAAVALWACVVILSPPPTAGLSRQTTTQAEPKAQAAPSGASTLSPKEVLAAQIDADSEKLVQLAEELKAELAKSGKDTLSLQVIKKANEVEKLAKSLKERLKRE
jgi:hypothetical protein